METGTGSLAVPAEDQSSGEPSSAQPNPPVGRSVNGRRWWPALVCCGLYLSLALLAFGDLSSIGPARMAGVPTPDTADQIWFLAWTHYALAHGLNPFFTQWQNYPAGINLLGTTSMMALGVMLSPITAHFGPIVAWNVLVRLSVALSALSMCLVLRRWVRWWPAAFIGGLFYGFSAYILLNVGHAFLIFVPLPPLMLLLVYEALVRQRWSPRTTGAILGVACALQYLISSEILVSTIIVGGVATVIYFVASSKEFKAGWPYIRTSLIFCVAIGGALLAYPALFTLLGPQHVNGAPQQAGTLAKWHGDLLASVKPGPSQWLSTKNLGAYGIANYGQYAYLGIPLVIALIAIVAWLRKRRFVLFIGLMAVISFFLSLGSTLYINGVNTHIPMPFAILTVFPWVDGLVAVRFSLYTSMFAAGIIAIGLDELRRHILTRSRPSVWTRIAAFTAPIVLAAVIAVPLLPSGPRANSPTGVSSFFTSKTVDVIPKESVVLSYPYPRAGIPSLVYSDRVDQGLLDQAASGMRYKIVGGYGWWPITPGNQASSPTPASLPPTTVESLFDRAFFGLGTPEQYSMLVHSNLSGDIRKFVRDHHVDTVVALPIGQYPEAVVRQVTAAIGPPRHVDGVDVWSNVQQRLKTVPPTAGPPLVTTPPTTGILRPAPGVTLSGVQVMDAGASANFGASNVSFHIAGQGHTVIESAVPTAYGWLFSWNTAAVPNGSYTVQSFAYGVTGLVGTSPSIVVHVKN